MQSQDLAQLSESLLSLLSVHNARNPNQGHFLPAHQLQHHAGQPPLYSQAHPQHEGQYPAKPLGAEHLNHHQGPSYSWVRSLGAFRDDRSASNAETSIPGLAQQSHLQQNRLSPLEDSNSSSANSNAAWGSFPKKEEHSHSLPDQHGFPNSSKLASGLWGGSLWSNGGDSIWSTSTDRPQADAQLQKPIANAPQNSSLLHSVLNHQQFPEHQSASNFSAHRPDLGDVGHAVSSSARPQLPANLPFTPDQHAELLQQGPSALLAALQAGSRAQQAMPNGHHHAAPPLLDGHHLSAQHQHITQVPHPLQILLQQQQQQQQQFQQQHQLPHLHQQQPHLQQQLHHQRQQQQHQLQQQLQLQHQKQQMPTMAQSPPVTAHLSRAPPPGFPRPLQQNLQEAQLQQSAAACASQVHTIFLP